MHHKPLMFNLVHVIRIQLPHGVKKLIKSRHPENTAIYCLQPSPDRGVVVTGAALG